MCGIAGFVSIDVPLESPVVVAKRMAQTLHHRGPDDEGIWTDSSAGFALAHTRLAIVDLSAAGHQPMVSSSGRLVVAFNGEIYNHLELRAALQVVGGAPVWRGHSDTETLLAGFEHWGVEATLQRCVGMFAIALWHRESCTLTLARDRLGEKPLYYGWVGRGTSRALVFGSELKALRAHPGFDSLVCREALAQYLRFMVVPAPRSIYQGIYKLEPGCILTLQGRPPCHAPAQPLQPEQAHGSISLQRWWSLAGAVEAGARNPLVSEDDAVSLLEKQLTEAVDLQSLGDVPLGAYLSGGVDSSTVVALLQRQSSRPVKTFTIGFDEVGFDESPHALAVARHLGAEHHTMRVNAKMAQEVIPRLPHIYDEPFADSSQIPTYLVCQAARQQVTVALSGDAADELFGGYNRYLWAPRLWQRLQHLPYTLRQAMAQGIVNLPSGLWSTLGAPWQRQGSSVVRLGEKGHKLASAMQGAQNLDDLYRNLVSAWTNPGSLVRASDGGTVQEPSSGMDKPLPVLDLDEFPLRIMYVDAMTYLPDDILSKVDRAAMACSLEMRAPFLDHRVVELAWRLPMHMKIRNNQGKWALRQVLYKYVPRELIERPKAGFAIPIGQWLRGPLREWAESLLAEQRLNEEGYFYPGPIRQAWAEHLSGKRDWTARIWAVLMFQAWLENEQA